MYSKIFPFLVLIAFANAGQNWYNFKTHWTPLVFDGFQDRPRTVADAEANGWTKISEDCTDGAKYEFFKEFVFSYFLLIFS